MEKNEVEILIYAVAAILIALGIFLLAVFLLYSKKQRLAARRIDELTREMLVAQLEIQETTLKNVSGEIHDNIGQVLSLVKLLINRMDSTKPSELAAMITESKNLVGQAIRDLRNIARTLDKDGVADLGLTQAILYQTEILQKAGFAVDLKGELPRVATASEVVIFRIVQEVFNNIIKHSGADHVSINLSAEQGSITVAIRDNGSGFDTGTNLPSVSKDPGLGIRNMRSRAELIGATFEIKSITGTGTSVCLSYNPTTSNLH